MSELTIEILNNFLVKTYFEGIEEPFYDKNELDNESDIDGCIVKKYFDKNGILRKTTIEDYDETLEQVELFNEKGELIYKACYEYIFEPKNAIMVVKINQSEMEEIIYSIPDLSVISKNKRTI